MTGSREAELLTAVDLLLDARRTATPIDGLPPNLRPTSLDEAYWMQDQLVRSFGDVGGWKVGAPSPEATPMAAPLPAAWIAPSTTTISGHRFRFRGLEAEVAFRLGSDLPPRAIPYSREEVYAAVASCHPALEVLESGFADPREVDRLCMIGDLQMHGAFLFGPGFADWRNIDFSKEHVAISVDASVRVERTGSNTAGDLMRLLPWLANEGATRSGGLRAGQWITTGSWTGVTLASARSSVGAHFANLGHVSLRFA